MAKRSGPPTVDQIKTEFNDWKFYYNTMHAQFRECEAAYDRQFTIRVPDDFEKYIPATGASLVDTAVDHIITRNPIVTVPPNSQKNVAQDTADKLERFYQCCITYNRQTQPTVPEKQAAKLAMIYGMFCYKGIIFDPNYDKGKGYSRRFPFRYQPLNPLTVFPSPAAFWGDEAPVIEFKEKTIGEARRLWPEFKNKNGKKDNEKGEMLERWSQDWRIYVMDDEIVMVKPNNIGKVGGYGYIPYEFGFSGMGYLTGKPEDLAQGFLWKILSALKAEAGIKTALNAITEMHAYPKFASTQDPNTLRLGKGPGAIDHIPLGKDSFWNEQTIQVPPLIYDNLGNVMGDIRQGSIVESLSGAVPKGVTSGYMVGLSISEARLKFGDTLDQIELKGVRTLGRGAWLIENVLKDKISVWGNIKGKYYEDTISPDDIRGNYNLFLDLSATNPEEEDRRATIGLNLFMNKAITRKRMQEKYLKIADTTGEDLQMMVETGMAAPEFQQAMAMAAIKAYGMEKFVQMAQEEAAKLKQQAKEQAGVSAVGGTPAMEEGMAAAGSTEEIDLQNRQIMAMNNPPGPGNPLPERGAGLG